MRTIKVDDDLFEIIYPMLKMLKKAGRNIIIQPEDEWINESEFKARSGKNTIEKLRHLRSKYPELTRFESYGVDAKLRPIRRNFQYNWTAYQKIFKGA